jgi:acyl-phosphate glycerol 3-phosphate acyltransferase
MLGLFGAAVLFGYLLGSIPTAYLVVRWVTRGAVDVRQAGDGNAGANNVNRICGRRWATLVGVVDIAKGVAAVLAFNLLSRLVNPALTGIPSGLPDSLAPAFALTAAGMLAGAATMAGQIWPIWLKFRGGRGAATALGITGAALPAAALIMALPCIALLVLTRSTIIALPFIYLTSMALARAVFDVGWGAIGYCLGIFIAVGAVHFWAVRSRRPAGGATPGRG